MLTFCSDHLPAKFFVGLISFLLALSLIITFTPSASAASVPANTSPPSVTGLPKAGQTVTCDHGTWTGADSYGYAWLRDGAIIASANGVSHNVSSSDIGSVLSCRVTATNAVGSASATSGPSAVVTSSVPINIEVPLVSGEVRVGKTLSCSTGIWDVMVPMTYQWLRAGAAISGARSSTYAPTDADVGSTLACRATATVSAGSASATSLETAAVLPAVPVSIGPPRVEGLAQVGHVLTCVGGQWTGAQALGYQWLRAGVAILGASAVDYAPSASDVGATLSCIVKAANAGGFTEATSAASVVIIAQKATITTQLLKGKPARLMVGCGSRYGVCQVPLGSRLSVKGALAPALNAVPLRLVIQKQVIRRGHLVWVDISTTVFQSTNGSYKLPLTRTAANLAAGSYRLSVQIIASPQALGASSNRVYFQIQAPVQKPL